MREPTFDRSCTRCALHKQATTVCVGGEGEPGGLLIVGENPGKDEDEKGRPFIGRTGQYFRPKLAKIARGLPIYITNAVKCVTRTDEEKEAAVEPCRVWLEQEIRQVKPKAILALGRTAVASLTEVRQEITTTRGATGVYEDIAHDLRIPVTFSLHPSAVLRMMAQEGWLEADMAKAVSLAKGKEQKFRTSWEDVIVKEVTAESDALRLLKDIRDCDAVSLDAETSGSLYDKSFRMLCLGLAYAGYDSATILNEALLRQKAVRKSIRTLVWDKRVVKIAHNAPYDLGATCGSRLKEKIPANVFDPMNAFRVFRPVQYIKAGLEKLAWFVNMGGYYEKWFERLLSKARADFGCSEGEAYALVPRIHLHRYCGMDAIAARRLHAVLAGPVSKIPSWDRFHMPAVVAAAKMSAEGLPIDVKAVERSRNYFSYGIQSAGLRIANNPDVRAFEKVQGKPFNPNSPPQMAAFLFDHLGFKSKKPTKTKRPSTDQEVLESLESEHEVVADVLRVRRFTKLKGSYVDAILRNIASDGRIHPNYKVTGTATGRWSAGGESEGGGNDERFNIQTLPVTETEEGRMVRSAFCAPEGYEFVEADLSQIEIRVAAILSGDEVMAQVFRDGKDFHQETARGVKAAQERRIVTLEEVTDEERRAAKAVNFGNIYGETPESLAAKLGISVKEAIKLTQSIFGVYKKLGLWMKENRRKARQEGAVWIYWDGKPVQKRLIPEVTSSDKVSRSKADRIIVNTPIQGSAALYTTATVIEMTRRLQPMRSRLVMTVHDSTVYLCPTDETRSVIGMVQKVATSWPSGNVPLKVDIKVGKRLSEMEKLKEAA